MPQGFRRFALTAAVGRRALIRHRFARRLVVLCGGLCYFPSDASDREPPLAGYSQTPLIRKLGLRPGARARVIEPPVPYATLLGIDPAPPVLAPPCSSA